MLPNLIIIGAQKAGTTSLHIYLAGHPQITMSKPKELNFFCGPGWRNWDRGFDWYASHWPTGDVRGESSPNYTAYPFVEDVPQRIGDLIPDCKLIYLVRDPLERLISHYIHGVSVGKERRSLPAIISGPNVEHTGYVVKSRYAMQLERYLERFDPAQILVVGQEELLRDRRGMLPTVFRFLDVEESWTPDDIDVLYNRSGVKRRPRWLRRRVPAIARAEKLPGGVGRAAALTLTAPVSRPLLEPDVRERLENLLRADADRLRAMTGKGFEDWGV